MEPRNIPVQIIEIQCTECNSVNKFPSLGDFSYGRFLGVSPQMEFAEFEAVTDPVFEELREIVRCYVPEKTNEINNCLHLVMGVCCDPAPSGEGYIFGRGFHCLSCNSKRIKVTKVSTGVENIPLVTHLHWNSLTLTEKHGIINQELQLKNCL